MCVCVCMKGGDRKKPKATGIASDFRVMFNEVKKQFRSTEGLRKHIFYVCLCFQDSEMYKHNNGLFGNVLLPCNDLQPKPISSHMGIEFAHYIVLMSCL